MKADSIVVVMVVAAVVACVPHSTARVHDVLCTDGDSSIEGEFLTGVRVSVGPVKDGSLAMRSCQASLAWGQQRIEIANHAAEVDLDMFGAYLDGYGTVAAFQIKQNATDCCRTYQIYSLEQPPRLLRTITGGDFFSGADTDLDERVEIWAGDAIAIHEFEGLSPSEIDFPPTLVLRVEKGRLHDVSDEFAPFYDHVIAMAKSEIDVGLLREFKESDGKLLLSVASSPLQLAHLRLRRVKVRVLEIVWGYLYSGRESEAWQILEEMWPRGDMERIRSAITSTRNRGIISQVDSASRSQIMKQNARIYEQWETYPPSTILMRVYPPEGAAPQAIEREAIRIGLVIDSAGKVRWSSIEESTSGEREMTVANSISEWKFVPAFRDNHPVTCRVAMYVWALR